MNFDQYIISEDISIMEAIKKIDENGRGIAFFCSGKKLLGVVSDGDIRRYILKKGDMSAGIVHVMNYQPKFWQGNVGTVKTMCEYMKQEHITALPIVDSRKNVMQIIFDTGERICSSEQIDIPVVIMAGGKGSRLDPYTRILPKPLIPVGNKTITEHILDRFKEYGCLSFKMIVNYKKKFIETYFAEDHFYNIQFLEEEKFLGTGGGLKLLGKMDGTFFMTNCDILVEADYADILKEHKRNKNVITMVCARKTINIPYGTVKSDLGNKVIALEEKPEYTFLANTGFYVIEPDFLCEIPENTFVHITDIIQSCIDKEMRVGIYPIEEDAWMDMGQLNELEKMRKRIGE